jgi:hypothetical protein
MEGGSIKLFGTLKLVDAEEGKTQPVATSGTKKLRLNKNRWYCWY